MSRFRPTEPRRDHAEIPCGAVRSCRADAAAGCGIRASLRTLMPNTVVAGGAASDVQVVPGMVVFGSAGGRGNEGRLQVDGLSVGSAFNGAGVSSYIADVGNAQEITMITSGGLGEAEVGGPSLNVVPKTGGNTP